MTTTTQPRKATAKTTKDKATAPTVPTPEEWREAAKLLAFASLPSKARIAANQYTLSKTGREVAARYSLAHLRQASDTLARVAGAFFAQDGGSAFSAYQFNIDGQTANPATVLTLAVTTNLPGVSSESKTDRCIRVARAWAAI